MHTLFDAITHSHWVAPTDFFGYFFASEVVVTCFSLSVHPSIFFLFCLFRSNLGWGSCPSAPTRGTTDHWTAKTIKSHDFIRIQQNPQKVISNNKIINNQQPTTIKGLINHPFFGGHPKWVILLTAAEPLRRLGVAQDDLCRIL